MISKKILLLSLLPILLVPVYAQEATTDIPVWVKGVANFWVEGNISDDEFGEAITFLIEQGIFKIDSVTIPESIQVISDGEKRLYELEIKNLEDEVKDVGLDNAHLLNSIVEKNQSLKNYETSITALQIELQQYTGIGAREFLDPNIIEGYKQEINELINQNNMVDQINSELKEEIDDLKEKIENLKEEIEDLE